MLANTVELLLIHSIILPSMKKCLTSSDPNWSFMLSFSFCKSVWSSSLVKLDTDSSELAMPVIDRQTDRQADMTDRQTDRQTDMTDRQADI